MKEKNFQKYPKWLKDKECFKCVMEVFANHKAQVVLNNERLFMIDWKSKDGGTEYEMHYTLDKEHGVFTLYGDFGEGIVYFSHRVEVEDLLSYLYMCSYDYFVEKIVTRSPYDFDYTLGTQEIEKRVSKVYLWVLCFFMACDDAGLRGLKHMTLRKLVEWAEKNDCLDCDVCVQYRDDGGLYHGRDYDIHPTLEVNASEKVVVL